MWSAFEKTGEVSPKSYFTNAADGSLLKSTTCVLAGPQQKPIGMLCINMNLSFPFPEIVKTLMPQCNVPQAIVSETFSNNANDVIQQALSSTIKEVDQDESVSSKGRNKAIIRCLFDNGVFELKETTTQVSEQLGISRQAVYKFIREFKSE
jgi:predicted transcriptional regulator YheO